MPAALPDLNVTTTDIAEAGKEDGARTGLPGVTSSGAVEELDLYSFCLEPGVSFGFNKKLLYLTAVNFYH